MAFPPASSSDFRRFAVERLEDAECLLRGGRTTGAIYIAGYVIECALKALILQHTPPSAERATIEGFKGNKAHDLDYLRVECLNRKVPIWPRDVHKTFVLVNREWSVMNVKKGMRRYDPGRADPQDADDLVEAARAFWTWAKRQLT